MAKRIFDFFAALFGLIMLSPLLLLIAIRIRQTMPGGSVIFRQKRVGQHGVAFTLYKFRTMQVAHHGCTVSVKGERRITPLGIKQI